MNLYLLTVDVLPPKKKRKIESDIVPSGTSSVAGNCQLIGSFGVILEEKFTNCDQVCKNQPCQLVHKNC